MIGGGWCVCGHGSAAHADCGECYGQVVVDGARQDCECREFQNSSGEKQEEGTP